MYKVINEVKVEEPKYIPFEFDRNFWNKYTTHLDKSVEELNKRIIPDYFIRVGTNRVSTVQVDTLRTGLDYYQYYEIVIIFEGGELVGQFAIPLLQYQPIYNAWLIAKRIVNTYTEYEFTFKDFVEEEIEKPLPSLIGAKQYTSSIVELDEFGPKVWSPGKDAKSAPNIPFLDVDGFLKKKIEATTPFGKVIRFERVDKV